MNITYYGQTEKGSRETNMDTILQKQRIVQGIKIIFVLICDGVGSLSLGGVAAKTTTDMLSAWFESLEVLDQIESKLVKRVKEISNYINETYNSHEIITASTLTAVLITESSTYCIHIGDSGMYRLNDGDIKKITIDDVSEINKLSSYVGQNCKLNVQFYELANNYDYILICSDGINKTISEGDIRKIVYSKKKVELITKKLIERAIINGEKDNITCAVVKLSKNKWISTICFIFKLSYFTSNKGKNIGGSR